MLLPPLGWLAIAYFGALLILLLNAFWAKDAFTGKVEPWNWSLEAFGTWSATRSTRTVALRTVCMAAARDRHGRVLAFPIAYYMARVASPRTRRMLVIAVLMPLWGAYLVKVYAWRTILQENGFLDGRSTPFGVEGPGLDELANTWLVFSYLWLPYMILPIYAGSSASRTPSSRRRRTWAARH